MSIRLLSSVASVVDFTGCISYEIETLTEILLHVIFDVPLTHFVPSELYSRIALPPVDDEAPNERGFNESWSSSLLQRESNRLDAL